MKNEPTNVRFAPQTLAKIKLAAEKSGEKSAEVMRIAMDLGLRRLEAVDYDIRRMIIAGVEASEQADAAPNKPRPKK